MTDQGSQEDEVAERLVLDEHGQACLDGTWVFFPEARQLADVEGCAGEPISVPGLWEAQGRIELDGMAWYRRRFTLDDAGGWWSLRFGAVMDLAVVWLNGRRIGSHDNAFTPFTVDPTGVLQTGCNELIVRVIDPALDDPEHLRLAHGKQGWANNVFPSRPSLYMTYGGIWQSVVLRRHGPVTLDSVFINGDSGDLCISVTLVNRSDARQRAELAARVVGRLDSSELVIEPGHRTVVALTFGETRALRWAPGSPHLHTAVVDVVVDGDLSDTRAVRFGLRTIRVDGTRLMLNDEPYRMKSVLVQGFTAGRLYAEGTRADIEAEVRAAQAMGFNTLRLHIKGFDPTYLDVCDELGMLLHCDIPIAEPIAHEELGADGESLVGSRGVQAVREQIERDRNHPSVVLWSVMNEVGLYRPEIRSWDGYERFARALVAAARASDPTRPVIENDWVEPDPDHVFAGDVLTAHWYGRLHEDYLDTIEKSCLRWRSLDRPLLVTEFGDWGLPGMPELSDPPFWDTRAIYATGLAATRWPASVARFISETQRYQGLSDRLQAEVFRRHDHIGGYCVTELTDVPHELNGLLDLHRRPKPMAVAEMARVNQVVLPILELDSLVVAAGSMVSAPLTVANDGEALSDVEIEAGFAESAWSMRWSALEGYRAAPVGQVVVRAPTVPGSQDLVLRLHSGGDLVSENRYPMHVVPVPSAEGIVVRLPQPSPATSAVLEAVGAVVGDAGPLVVGEQELGREAALSVRAFLEGGGNVVVLAQGVAQSAHYPVPVTLQAVETVWGSSVFHFTTDNGAIPSLSRRNVLVAEDSTVQARSIVLDIGGAPFPDTPVVIAYKPVPDALTGTVVGSHEVGAGRLIFCQYRLCGPAARGDAAALALLADLVRWASTPRPLVDVEEDALADGRRVARYSHHWAVAR
ncbi:MAG TPA: glycoside hydrolase family 2 TIM barrel-domain containing protein [Acidimicrobiales bacterium]|nr:glycoside hydrolase family 2 TIM barrel-domain containing protein [Acidimicrobiales bacterium]